MPRVAACFWLALALALPARGLEAGAHAGDLLAGVVEPWSVPLAGYSGRRVCVPDWLGQHRYAHWLRPGQPGGGPVRVKALVLREGPERVAFVSLDVIGISRELRQAILADLASRGLGFDALVLSGTHTHSGPGALGANHLLEYFAVDRLVEVLRDQVVRNVGHVVAEAHAGLEPATLHYVGGLDARALARNRARALDPDHVDETVNLLVARASDGRRLAALLNLGVHGTVFKAAHDRLDADLPGALERAFETAFANASAPFHALFLNGAEGDIEPKSGPADFEAAATAFAQTAFQLWSSGPPPLDPSAGFDIAHTDVPLGRPFYYLYPNLPTWLKWIPLAGRLGGDVALWFGDHARITSIGFAGMRFVTFPGEPTADIGLALRQHLMSQGIDRVWILSLTDDHLGYFTSHEDWCFEHTAVKSSIYGPDAGGKLIDAHLGLIP